MGTRLRTPEEIERELRAFTIEQRLKAFTARERGRQLVQGLLAGATLGFAGQRAEVPLRGGFGVGQFVGESVPVAAALLTGGAAGGALAARAGLGRLGVAAARGLGTGAVLGGARAGVRLHRGEIPPGEAAREAAETAALFAGFEVGGELVAPVIRRFLTGLGRLRTEPPPAGPRALPAPRLAGAALPEGRPLAALPAGVAGELPPPPGGVMVEEPLATLETFRPEERVTLALRAAEPRLRAAAERVAARHRRRFLEAMQRVQDVTAKRLEPQRQVEQAERALQDAERYIAEAVQSIAQEMARVEDEGLAELRALYDQLRRRLFIRPGMTWWGELEMVMPAEMRRQLITRDPRAMHFDEWLQALGMDQNALLERLRLMARNWDRITKRGRRIRPDPREFEAEAHHYLFRSDERFRQAVMAADELEAFLAERQGLPRLDPAEVAAQVAQDLGVDLEALRARAAIRPEALVEAALARRRAQFASGARRLPELRGRELQLAVLREAKARTERVVLQEVRRAIPGFERMLEPVQAQLLRREVERNAVLRAALGRLGRLNALIDRLARGGPLLSADEAAVLAPRFRPREVPLARPGVRPEPLEAPPGVRPPAPLVAGAERRAVAAGPGPTSGARPAPAGRPPAEARPAPPLGPTAPVGPAPAPAPRLTLQAIDAGAAQADRAAGAGGRRPPRGPGGPRGPRGPRQVGFAGMEPPRPPEVVREVAADAPASWWAGDPGRVVAQLVSPTLRAYLRKQGPAGEAVRQLVDAAEQQAARRMGEATRQILEPVARLPRPLQEHLRDVVEGTAAPRTEQVAALADRLRAYFAARGREIQELGLSLVLPNGRRVPFEPRAHYWPVVYDPAKVRLRSGGYRIEVLEHLVQSGQARDLAEAQQLLEWYFRRPRERIATFQHARVLTLPDAFRLPPAEELRRTILQGSRRLAEAAVYGPDDARLVAAVRGLPDREFAGPLIEHLRGSHPIRDHDALVQRILDTGIWLHLGWAQLLNAGQSFNTLVQTGLKPFVRGVARLLNAMERREALAFVQRAGVAFGPDELTSMAAEIAGLSETEWLLAGRRFLRATGFLLTERYNRVFAALAGREWAQDLFAALRGPAPGWVRRAAGLSPARIRRLFGEMGVDVDAALRRGQLSRDDLYKAAYYVAQRTQFTFSRLELPTAQLAFFGHSPWGRLFFQFKRFASSQAEFLWEQTVREVWRFVRSGGQEGSLRQLGLLLAVAPHLGWLLADLRSLLRFGERAERPQHPLQWYLEGLWWVGGFGILQDILRAAASASQYNLRGLIVPAAVDDLFQLAAAGAQAAEGDWGVAARQALALVPVLGAGLARGQLPGGLTVEPLQELVAPREALVDAFLQAIETGDQRRLERLLREGKATLAQARALRTNPEVELRLVARELARTRDPERRAALLRLQAGLRLVLEEQRRRRREAR